MFLTGLARLGDIHSEFENSSCLAGILSPTRVTLPPGVYPVAPNVPQYFLANHMVLFSIIA